MSGPIQQAIDALEAAEMAFRDHGLLTKEKCVVCRRMIKGGSHTSDCAVANLGHASRRLKQFIAEISS